MTSTSLPSSRMVTGGGSGAGTVGLAVTEWGSADRGRPTIVLVHGYPDTSAMWYPVADLLARRYHVVAYDVRGAGHSSAPRGTPEYALGHLVEDLAAVADATSPDRAVHLVGHDWGSIQGWEAVSTDAMEGRIASYTSIYAPGLDHAAAWVATRGRHPTPHHLRQLAGQQVRSWYVVALHLPGAAAVWRAGLGRRWPRVLQKVEGVAPSETYPAPTISADGAQGIALYRANFRDRLTHPHPRPTTVPVQVIVPTKDHFVSPALSEGLEQWAPKLWRTEVVAGHWLPRIDPELVARYVSEFVDHVEGGPESLRLQGSRVVAPHGRGARNGNRARLGQVVVVTGAGGGIGRATALAFAAEGATVVAADIDPDAAARTATMASALATGLAQERDAPRPESHAWTVDVADAEGMEALAKWVEHTFGAPDVVVNNAGIGLAGPLLDTTVADWEHILGVNLWGVIHGSRLFGRQMADRREGGHIVNVASAAAFTPSRAYPAYATTKSAVLMLTECLRGELAGVGIAVHAVCPGLVDTTISTSTRHVGVSEDEQDRRRRAAARLYRHRGLTADEVAAAITEAVGPGAGSRAAGGRRAVVPVGIEARLGRALSRLSPAASRRLARIDFIARLGT